VVQVVAAITWMRSPSQGTLMNQWQLYGRYSTCLGGGSGEQLERHVILVVAKQLHNTHSEIFDKSRLSVLCTVLRVLLLSFGVFGVN
jgi:hypothetical protein